jgi:DNA polymerase elongation subunit (family B)
MSYVDAIYDRKHNRIKVVERINGKRVFTDSPVIYEFYYADVNGKYKSVNGDSVSRVRTKNFKEYSSELKVHSHKKIFESDCNQIFKHLSNNYLGIDAPDLHIAYFDIETDFDPERGFSSPSDPFTKITAVSLYLGWTESLICLVIPPPNMSKEEAESIVSGFENTYLYYDEKDMLLDFIKLVDDADVLTGWNSESFDIPYMINRMIRIMSKADTRDLCLWDQYPKKKTFEKYGAESESYDLIGRLHLDYMLLYQKYTFHEMHSYSLDAIGEYELGEHKVTYAGTLDQLYNQDFKTFIEYSRQDTYLLYRIDQKKKFIELANVLAHDNTVLLPTTMGSVAMIEQAIMNEAHRRDMVIPNKKHISTSDDTKAAGAYVAKPKAGIHRWVGSIDINSLYPSIIRALNLAPETIIGQLRPDKTDSYIQDKMANKKLNNGKTKKGASFADAWEDMFGSIEYTDVINRTPGTTVIIDWEDGTSLECSSQEAYDIIFNESSNLSLSANGTILTYDVIGVIPGLLERWYSERKVMQATKKNWVKLRDGIDLPARLL